MEYIVWLKYASYPYRFSVRVFFWVIEEEIREELSKKRSFECCFQKIYKQKGYMNICPVYPLFYLILNKSSFCISLLWNPIVKTTCYSENYNGKKRGINFQKANIYDERGRVYTFKKTFFSIRPFRLSVQKKIIDGYYIVFSNLEMESKFIRDCPVISLIFSHLS